MGSLGLCVFCLLKFSVAMCILLVKKLESMLFCVRVNRQCGQRVEVLRNSMQKCGKILRGEKILSPPWLNIAGASAPDVPTPLESRGAKIMKGVYLGAVSK